MYFVCIYDIGCGDHESHWIPGTQIYTYTAILINSPDSWKFFFMYRLQNQTNPQIRDYTMYTWAFMRIKCSTLFVVIAGVTRSVLESLNNRLIIQTYTYKYMDYVQNYKYYMYPVITVNHLMLNSLCWQSYLLPGSVKVM